MTYWDHKLLREQLDEKLQRLALATAGLPWRGGWVKLMRQALGMTTTQLAHRAGLDQSRIPRIEKQERGGDLKLSTMEKIAEALDMRFVYGFVPNDTLDTLMTNQARKIAQERMKHLSHTMSLEEQQLSDSEAGKALKDMIQKILVEEPKDFWDK